MAPTKDKGSATKPSVKIKTRSTKTTKPSVKTKAHRVVKRPARGFHRFRNGILNVTPKGGEKTVTRNNQASPLLRLPPELRQYIWEYVFGPNRRPASTGQLNRSYNYPRSSILTPNHSLGLLRVCRQVYAETALFPYKFNTFNLGHSISNMSRLNRLPLFQRRRLVNVQLQVLWRTGLTSDPGWLTKQLVHRFRCRYGNHLDALKSITVRIFKPKGVEGMAKRGDAWVCDAIKDTREQLDSLFDTSGLSITFEEVDVSSDD